MLLARHITSLISTTSVSTVNAVSFCRSIFRIIRIGADFLGPEGLSKGKVLPYSLPSVGLGADPGVQAFSPQVTFRSSQRCHYFTPGLRLYLVSVHQITRPPIEVANI